MIIEKVGTSKDIWVTCPHCRQLYYVERSFWEPTFNHLLLYCPFCHKEFDKKDSPKVWGL